MNVTLLWQLINLTFLGGVIYAVVLFISRTLQSNRKINQIEKDIKKIKEYINSKD